MNTSQLSRQRFLQTAACGFGGLALSGLMNETARAVSPLVAQRPHYSPRAKRMIFVFLAGGPSQADLFAPKTEITKKHNLYESTQNYLDKIFM